MSSQPSAIKVKDRARKQRQRPETAAGRSERQRRGIFIARGGSPGVVTTMKNDEYAAAPRLAIA
jgi:hypothetical protein